MSLSDEQRLVLLRVIETLIPMEPSPAPVHESILATMVQQLQDDKKELAQPLAQWLDALAIEAGSIFCDNFVDLHRQTRDEMFDRIECDNLRCEWPVDAHAWFDTVVNWVADIHLGADDPVE